MLAFGSIFKCLSKGRQIKWFLGSIQNKTVTSVIYKCSHCFRVKNNSYTFQLHQCKSSIIKIDPSYGLYVFLSKNISSCAALSIDGVFAARYPKSLFWNPSGFALKNICIRFICEIKHLLMQKFHTTFPAGAKINWFSLESLP